MTDTLFKARVTAGHGRHHYVEDAAGHLFEARRRGKKNDVTVGDYVECRQADSETVAVEAVLPRKTLLFRSDEWRVKELAANVDLVAVVFASRPTFNPWFVWKAVVAAKTAGIDVVAIRNKSDLTEGREACDAFAASLPAAGCPCLTLSAYDADDVLTKLTPLLENKTTLLIGQSGMGKSTLINVLCPEAQAKTREFSEALDLGKQTTTATRLYRTKLAGSEASIIDSPGFQEFGLAHVTRRNILEAMPDIAQYAQGCRFYNCTHTHEPGCSVRAAAEAGKVSPERYAFFCAVTEEAKNDVF